MLILINFISISHLKGRYSSFEADDKFNSWLSKHRGRNWHETDLLDNGRKMIVVQSLDGLHLFASEIEIEDSKKNKITNQIEINLLKDFTGRETALKTLIKKNILDNYLAYSIKPMVIFNKEDIVFYWEIVSIKNNEMNIFNVDSKNNVELIKNVKKTSLKKIKYHESQYKNDYLASNDLHHIDNFKDQAISWTIGLNTTREKAERIALNVYRLYKYDSNIPGISEFTWCDTLVRDFLGCRGICDEWATVQITCLRAIGIQATMKFLIGEYNNQGCIEDWGHAVLEYLCDGRWLHLDGLWLASDRPSIYRESGVSKITVMDATYPLDSRYSGLCFGLQDPIGDGKINYWKDNIIYPDYPGNMRFGYSY